MVLAPPAAILGEASRRFQALPGEVPTKEHRA